MLKKASKELKPDSSLNEIRKNFLNFTQTDIWIQPITNFIEQNSIGK